MEVYNIFPQPFTNNEFNAMDGQYLENEKRYF